MDLTTCPDFTEDQPRRVAEMPRFPGHWARKGECPVCDYDQHDMRKRAVCRVRRYGWRFGAGAGKRRAGVDIVCCGLM